MSHLSEAAERATALLPVAQADASDVFGSPVREAVLNEALGDLLAALATQPVPTTADDAACAGRILSFLNALHPLIEENPDAC